MTQPVFNSCEPLRSLISGLRLKQFLAVLLSKLPECYSFLAHSLTGFSGDRIILIKSKFFIEFIRFMNL